MNSDNLRFVGNLFFKVRLTTLTGMRIGRETPYRFRGADLTPILHPLDGRPFIPGTTMKGKLRYLLEWIDGVGEPHNAKVRYPHRPCAMGTYSSSACVLFGTATRPSRYPNGPGPRQAPRELDGFVSPPRLTVRDLRMLDTLEPLETTTQVALDRVTFDANPRTGERVRAGIVFEGIWSFALFVVKDPSEPANAEGPTLARELAHLDRLFMALRMLQDDALGQDGTRGSGQVTIEVVEPQIKFREDYLEDGVLLKTGQECIGPKALTCRFLQDSASALSEDPPVRDESSVPEDASPLAEDEETALGPEFAPDDSIHDEKAPDAVAGGYLDVSALVEALERLQPEAGSRKAILPRTGGSSSAAIRFRLRPETPFKDAPFHSDTLFGALCWAWRRLGGELDALLDHDCPIALTSLAPFVGDVAHEEGGIYAWRRPRTPLPDSTDLGWVRRSRTYRRSCGWLSEEALKALRSGALSPETLSEEGAGFDSVEPHQLETPTQRPLAVDGLGLSGLFDTGKDPLLILPGERKQLAGILLGTSPRTGVGLVRPLAARQGQTRTAIDRLTGTAADHQLFFDDAIYLDSARCGLWGFLVAPESSLEGLLAALSLAGDMGLGGDRSSGRGQVAVFASPVPADVTPVLEPASGAAGAPHLLLSLALPTESVDLDGGACDQELRQGMTDLAAGGRFKPSQYRLVMMAPGAVMSLLGPVGGLTQVSEGHTAGNHRSFTSYRLTRGVWLPWFPATDGRTWAGQDGGNHES